MKRKGSKIATSIDVDYRKEKRWKEKIERIKQTKITILDEHSKKPLIIEKEDK